MHIVIILIIAAVLGVLGTAYFTGDQGTETPANTPIIQETATDAVTTTASHTPTETPAQVEEDQTYNDGTYDATGTYTSPAGQESVDVTLTLKDDIVIAATFQGNATHPTSKLNQGKFAAGYQAYVVGKPLDSIHLSVVNGSSLAPKGFMDALADIKAEAQT